MAQLPRLVASEVGLSACLFALALAPRLFLVWQNQFDGLYGQDAYAYFDYARELLASLARGNLPPAFFWPLGYPALIAFAFLFLGSTPLAGQAITVLVGALTAPLTFLLTRELTDDKNSVAGLVAGLGIALGGQHVQSSIVLMADVPALFWATLSALALMRYPRANQTRWLALCAATLVFATITRWIYGSLALGWGLILLLNYFKVRNTRRFLFALGIAMVLGLFLLGPQIALSAMNPDPVLNHSWLVGWNPLNALNRVFDNVDGHFAYPLPVGIFYAQTAFHPAYLSPLLTIFLLVGAFVVAWQTRRRPLCMILLFSWVVTQYVFLAGIPYENFRFGLSYLVPLAILTGIGFVRAFESRIPFLPFPARGITIVLVLAGFAFNLLWLERPSQVVFDIKRVELDLVHALAARVPSDATIITFGPTLALEHYTQLKVVELSTETPTSLAVRAQQSKDVYLLVNVENLASQWQGLVPQTNFQFLRAGYDFSLVAEFNPYTLFAIQKP